MKLNNKGMTLVEIIISIVLISIVLIFLFNLLIYLKDFNKDNQDSTDYLILKSTFVKNVEEDLKNCTSSLTFSSCNGNCVSIKNDSCEIDATISILYSDSKKEYVLTYKNGSNFPISVILPDYDKYNDINSDKNKINFKTSSGFSLITIPIMGSDKNDYSILISHYGTSTT